MIEKIEFGKIRIKGKEYSEDIIIFWDGEIVEKEKSHVITKKDMEDVLVKEPECIVIGTGTAGAVEVEKSALEVCKNENVEVKILATKEAVEEFNKLFKERKKVAGIFHLTC